MFDIHESLPICHDLDGEKHRTSDVVLEEKVKFSSLLLKEEIQSGLTRCGYSYLSPIQKNALPIALTGTSIIAHAKSGTGKTLVYVLSALNSILERKQQNIQCLILSPTREIAKQIYDVFKNVGYYVKDLKVEYFIGGTPLDIDVLKCKECHVAIGAPGRIKHLIELGELKTESIQMLVLDEVDALLCNKEFAIRELASYLPSEKQTIVCTATFSDHIKQLLIPISSTIQYITVSEKTSENENGGSVTSNILIGIKQYVASVFCDSTSLDTIRKRNKLIEILRSFKYDQCFIFVNYVTIAKGLCNMLVSNNLPALWVSSEMNQSTRISTLNKLKLNQCNILVTTDLAARGIDVHNVNLVINMGIPSPPDVYIHRMGRAGRYGSEGAVITIVHEGQEMEQFRKLICSVSTDPVVLYILPNEITKTVHDQELDSVDCLPDLNASVNLNEYHFKKNHENHGQKTGKKKTKKSKKKKPKKDATARQEQATDDTEKCDSSDENIANDVVVDKEMEKLVEQYIVAIKEEISRDRVTIDENSLRHYFKLKEPTFKAIRFSNYFKPTFMDVGKDDDDDDVFVLIHDNAPLLQYARFIKKKHAFLDEQKIPCSILQFLELIRRNENLVNTHVSVNVCDSVKEILNKIGLISKQDRKKSKTEKTKPIVFELGSIDKNSLKRINDQVSEGPPSLDTVNSIEQETSNWMISRTEYLSAKYSPKRSKNQHGTPVKNFTAAPPNLNDDTPYMVFKASRLHLNDMGQSDCDHYTTDDLSTKAPLPDIPVRSRLLNRPPSTSHSNDITCPNCRHTFALPRTDDVPILQPISAYVNEDMERKIWQNHFNFVYTHVRSLPFVFGNR